MTKQLHPYVIINPGPVNDPRNGDNPEADTLARRSLEPEVNKKTGEKQRKGIISSIRQIAEEQLLNEAKMSVDKFKGILEHFVKFVIEELDLKSSPKIILKCTEDFSQQAITFGTFNTQTEETSVSITNRHPMDVLRSIAHEICHHKQLEDGRLEEGSGETGSDIENEANAMAGILMRDYGKAYPELFGSESISANRKIDENIRKIFDGKTGPRKLFDKDSKKEHDKNSKNKQANATTGGNTAEYEDSVEEDVKVVQVTTHKGVRYKKEFQSPEEYEAWIDRARKKGGKKIEKIAEELLIEKGLLKSLLGKKSKPTQEDKFKSEWLTKEKKRELAQKWRKERQAKQAKAEADEKKTEVHKSAYKRWAQAARSTVDKHINIGGKMQDRKQFYKDNANYHADALTKRGIKTKRLDESNLPPNHHKNEALKKALGLIDQHFGPGGKYDPKVEKQKYLEHRKKDPEFNKWLADRGRKNPYVKESVVVRPPRPKNELKMYKNDPRDNHNAQLDQAKKQLIKAKVDKIKSQINDIKRKP